MKNILVLCTGNSCRSIMVEALINELGAGRFKAVSAGSRPAGYVHPKSIETLKRFNTMVNEPRSKSWDEFKGQNFDLVITVCDAAAAESCPAFLGEHEKLHWSTPDPAAVKGSEDEINAAFTKAFSLLKKRVELLIAHGIDRFSREQVSEVDVIKSANASAFDTELLLKK